LARRLNDAEGEEFFVSSLAMAYHSVGLNATAVDLLAEAIESARLKGHKDNEASLQGHLGNVFSINGAYHRGKRAL
jgi:hypothetical protein